MFIPAYFSSFFPLFLYISYKNTMVFLKFGQEKKEKLYKNSFSFDF